jgi:hypothetical protein
LEETKKKEDLDPAAVLAAVEKKLAEECHFAVNKVEDMEKKGFWSIRICPLEMVTAKGSSSNNVGFAKFAEDGKMPMSEVTALKSAIETMATEMD